MAAQTKALPDNFKYFGKADSFAVKRAQIKI
jgi:hypothetical protein